MWCFLAKILIFKAKPDMFGHVLDAQRINKAATAKREPGTCLGSLLLKGKNK